MKLSIIVPIYNVSEYLADTLDTVLTQIFDDFELILVNDGSCDLSGHFCDEYAKKDSRVVVIHKVNGGVSEARNIGVSFACGEYIGFVDSDDIIEPCMYELMFKCAEDYDCDIVQCEHNRNNYLSNNIYTIDDENFSICDGISVVRDIFIKKDGRCTNILALWSKIYKRELFDGIVFPIGKVFEDEARTYQVILKAKQVGNLNLPLYHYIKRQDSIITGIAIIKYLNKAWAFKDRMEFFRGRDQELFEKSTKSYYNFLISALNDMKHGIVIYTNEDETILQFLIDDYDDFTKYGDKYAKIYLFMMKHNIFVKWIRENEFEPIQRIVAKIKGLK